MTLRRLLTPALLAAAVLVSCGDDGAGDGPGGDGPASPTPAAGACPESTELRVETTDGEPVSIEPVSAFAEHDPDDSLYGDHYVVVVADFPVELGQTLTTESGQHALQIQVLNRDQTRPGTGTFDFEGTQNTYFQPTFYADGVARPVTTVGEGGTLTLSVADDEQVCGGIDVSDGAVTIQGSFSVPVQTAEI